MESLNFTQPLILASSSPRRHELLQQLGVEFSTYSPNIDEQVLRHETPEQYVERLAWQKAHIVMEKFPDAIVIAGDTCVSLDGQVLGQAETLQQAVEIWSQLSGVWHVVMTGICVGTAAQNFTQVISTQVKFKELSIEEMEQYWNTGEPLGKAGAYAIQGIGGQFVEQIIGSYDSVVGLPVAETAELLKHFSTQ